MALAYQTRLPTERELEEREVIDIPVPLIGPPPDPSGGAAPQGGDIFDASGMSMQLDLFSPAQYDILIRGASEWQLFSTKATGRDLMASVDAAAARTAIGAEPIIVAGTTGQYWRGDKSWQTLDNAAVGLGNVTNDAQVKRTEMGVANGVATLDSGGKVPLSQISDTILGQVEYQGAYNATTNSPTLANPPASTTKGDYYVVSVAGTQFGLTFAVGDWIISNGTAWEKVDNTDQVTSVAGRIGAITLGYADITDLASWTGSNGITTLGTVTTGTIGGTCTINTSGSVTGGAASFTTLNITGFSYSSASNNLLLSGADGVIYRSGGSGTGAGGHRFRYYDADVLFVGSAGIAVTGTATTSDPNDGAGAWLLGKIRTGVALVVSTTAGIQIKVDGTLYTLALLTTNP